MKAGIHTSMSWWQAISRAIVLSQFKTWKMECAIESGNMSSSGKYQKIVDFNVDENSNSASDNYNIDDHNICNER
jgi:hypothetical protein